MAVGYQLDNNVAINPSFIQQVTVAMLNAAVAIAAEASNTAGHAQRFNLAVAVLNAPQNYAQTFALAAVSDDVTTAGVTDAALQTRINSLWSALAGFDPN
jgi:hypothetical protein